ncbi:MAG: alpha/beta fold hydrolase [Aeromicrobium sp.]
MILSRLAYDRKGSGEPVVLLHGIGHRRQAWDPVVNQLAGRYDVIAVDLAGFGESASYPEGVPYDMETACENLAANFAEWGIERPHVVGNSLGGAISLELGARGIVASVTAINPAGFYSLFGRIQAFFILLLLRIASMVPNQVLRAVSKSLIGRHRIGSYLYMHPERFDADQVYGDALAMKHSTAFGPTIKAGMTYRFNYTVPVPTTVAWGTRDRILHYSQSGRAQELLCEARHVALPYCGHVPMIDDPELVIRVIDRTIAETSRTLEETA